MSFDISLCVLAKDESNCIGYMLESVLPVIKEVILVDTDSIDNTIQIATDICIKYNIPLRIYKVGFTDFGSIRTLACHLARCDWILTLDCDEYIHKNDLQKLRDLPAQAYIKKYEAIALPRRRWLDIEMTKEHPEKAYPDYQVRFFKNNILYHYERELHEYFSGCKVDVLSDTITPHIHHLHDVWKTTEKKIIREKLYKYLAIKAKVEIEGGKKI